MTRLVLIPFLTALPLVALPRAAQAKEAPFICRFTTECSEAEPCTTADFSLTVDLENSAIRTEYGDLTVVAVKREAGLKTLFATGAGAEYLLSLTPGAARLSTQNNKGPEMLGYLGGCTGAFE